MTLPHDYDAWKTTEPDQEPPRWAHTHTCPLCKKVGVCDDKGCEESEISGVPCAKCQAEQREAAHRCRQIERGWSEPF